MILLIRKLLCLFFCLILVSFQTKADSLSEKIQQTAFSQEWLALVHYQPTWYQTYKSSIDSDNFFLAPDGKTNPKHELEATLRLFQSNDTTKQCLFPARYLFLKQHNFIQNNFVNCPDYQSFQKDLNPNGITFIFTDAYMNNPASLFGHTLMRTDAPKEKTQLMAYGMNYGAWVDEKTAGALYALYGLTGGYYGGFTVKPYYSVINMYNNIENRDIWEYQLQLTPDEQAFYVAHLWEVGQTQTRYYFFTKNCSYLLMEVLDAVRPSLKLAQSFPLQTVPLDTVKAVAGKEGLLQSENYRPSRQRRITYRYEQMSPTEKEALKDLLFHDDFSKTNALSAPQKAAVLDTAYEYVQYQWIKQDILLDDYRAKSFQILKERRKMTLLSTEEEIKGVSPLLSHDSMRIQGAFGTHQGKTYAEVKWRPAYHALTDSAIGLSPESEIQFLETVFRYYTQKKRLYLQEITLLKISSFSPYSLLFKPLSYQIETGIKREKNFKTKTEKLMYSLSGGSGLTFSLTSHMSIYGLVNSVFQYGGKAMPHHFGVGIGVSSGILYHRQNWQTQIEGKYWLSDNEMIRKTSIKGEISYHLARNWAIGTSYEGQKRVGGYENDFRIFLNRYF